MAGLAILDGDLERGERMMWENLELGRELDNPLAVELFSAQALALRRLQGRTAEIHAGSKAMTQYFTATSLVGSGLATIYAELGLAEQARAEFERFAVNDFGDILDDVFWLATMYLLADVCLFLGDRARAAMLYERLLPYADRYVVLGAICAPAGCVERGLGVLAGMLGRHGEAVERLKRAVSRERSIGAMPAVAFAQTDLAHALAARGEPGDADQARAVLGQALELAAQYELAGLGGRVLRAQSLLDGGRPAPSGAKPFGARARALRDDAKAAITTRGRDGVGRLFAGATDEELERRFGSPLALRGLLTALSKGFQPRMAFGFEGEIQLEIRIPTASGAHHTSEWWTLRIEGERAVARRRTSRDPAVTIHANIADLIRLIGGLVNPMELWVDKRLEVEGDFLLGPRLVELFGGEAPLDIASGHPGLHGPPAPIAGAA